MAQWFRMQCEMGFNGQTGNTALGKLPKLRV